MSQTRCVNYRPGRLVPVRQILAPLHRGVGDPSMTMAGQAVLWAVRTPDGPVTSIWQPHPDGADVWCAGPGAGWLADRVPQVLGEHDDVTGFDASALFAGRPQHLAAARHPSVAHWRVAKTSLVLNSLIPSIIEQKVTGKQAFGAYRRLVQRYGEPAPQFCYVSTASDAPAASFVAQTQTLRVPPSVATWRTIPSWTWLQAGVESSASRTIMRALEVSDQLEETARLPLPDAHARLRSVQGIGVWTTAKVAQTAWGDADAATFADYHVAHHVGTALVGRDVDDTGMATLLEPFRPHRYRAEWTLLQVAGRRPRRGARMSVPTHLPLWG